MKTLTAAEIVSRAEALKGDTWSHRSICDEITRYCRPHSGSDFFRDDITESSVQWDKPWHFDSTAINAARMLASTLHGSVTSPATKWYGLKFEQSKLNDEKEASEWIEEVTNRTYQAIQESNFNLEVNIMYHDLVTYGTACIVEEANAEEFGDWQGIDFKTIPIKELLFEQDHRGKVKNIFREMEWTAGQIYDKFGPDGIPDAVKKKMEEASSETTKFTIIFAVYKRDDMQGQDTTKAIPPLQRPWGFKYVMAGEAEMLGEEGGFYENPVYLVRFDMKADSMWGCSPAMDALPDIQSLNRLIEFHMAAEEKAIDPPLFVSQQGIIGDVDLSPGGITVTRSKDDITPFIVQRDFKNSWDLIMAWRASIRETFYVDQLQLKDSPAMTATEVQVRYELMQRYLGPTLGRLQADLIAPLVKRTIAIMMRADQLPAMPEVLMVQQATLHIELVGPLARSQQMESATAIDRWVGAAVGMAQANEEVLDVVIFDGVLRQIGGKLGVSPDLWRSESEVNQIRQQRQQMQQLAYEAEMAQQAGAGMQAMAEGQQAMQANVIPEEPAA